MNRRTLVRGVQRASDGDESVKPDSWNGNIGTILSAHEQYASSLRVDYKICPDGEILVDQVFGGWTIVTTSPSSSDTRYVLGTNMNMTSLVSILQDPISGNFYWEYGTSTELS